MKTDHIGYLTTDIAATAKVLGGRRICYLWSQDTGFVELAESTPNVQ